ncbi:hypothetical protein W97_05015 [Coniosporium apollinis CBS 100218]|uniref:F-box domain-containing protein n=1 Tax=Coniosporium apollinis (strain CBS 100218) TaxID=1168221 RepID=R7YVT6_CONA1|nr:uncharacterized protein W97_05015 [Coniosporium apollinis CBS 100218]EON65776.1 hypothetical protein W97_05015 [Coniosporium apollinis CBS 100218]
MEYLELYSRPHLNGQDSISACDMLQWIQADRGVAQRITSLRYEDHRHKKLSPDHASKLQAITKNPELFQPAGQLDHVRPLVNKLLQEGSSEDGDLLALTVLLLLLPNLESLKLSTYAYGYNLDIIDKMVLGISQSHRTAPPDRPLQKLSHVTFEALEMGTLPIQHLLSFSAIPSVRKLSGDCITADAFAWRLGDLDSSAEEVEFKSSFIDAESLQAILPHLPGLRIFKYEHGPTVLNETSRFEPSEFFDVMASCLANSIRDVKFTFSMPEDAHFPRLGSAFLGFKELRKLDTHVEFLRDAVPDGVTDDSDEDEALESGFHSVDSDKEDEDRLLPLVAILPPSLELLRLKVGPPYMGEEVEALFEDFPALKETKLPRLRQISMTYIDIDVATEIREMCAEVGVKVCFRS